MSSKYKKPLRLVFMGTPELAAKALSDLYDAGYELPLVITQPDSPQGRGYKTGISPVKAFAMSKCLTVYQPEGFKEEEALRRVKEAEPDAIIVAAYGKILPASALVIAPLGCLNIHTSLLPAYRGAAPIQWALLNGETETGVTIIKLDEGIDTGPILAQEKLSVSECMDYGALYNALTSLGSSLLLRTLPRWERGELTPRDQTDKGASYARMLTREHELISWVRPASVIANQARAFSPAPGARASFDGKEIKILLARAVDARTGTEFSDTNLMPGTIAGIIRGQGPLIQTGDGLLLIKRVQPAGKKPMDAWAWLNGSRLKIGQSFT